MEMNEILIEHVTPPSNVKRLRRCLQNLEAVRISRLCERVDINEYAEKLAAHADIFYARCGEKDIGNCAVYLNCKKEGFISTIAVEREYQGMGVGQKLWEEVKKNMCLKSISVIRLKVMKKIKKLLYSI